MVTTCKQGEGLVNRYITWIYLQVSVFVNNFAANHKPKTIDNMNTAKKLKTLLLAMLACMTAWSQNLMLSQEEPEDEIAVVGFFCKNDTMTYRQTHNKYKVQGNDTTVSESYEAEFMIVVTDSTSDGYKMKYIPLSFTLHDADTVTRLMTKAMSQLMQSVECEFTTDEMGSLKSITNWREIRDQFKKGVKGTCDSLYSTIPGLDSIMPRKSLENILLLGVSTEEDIRDSYEELENLFVMHGSIYDLGDKEVDTEEQGYPQHISARIGYTPIKDEENDFDGDYAISTLSTTTIPVEDVMDLGFGALSMIVSDMANDSLEAVRDQIVDSLKIAKPNGAEVIVKEYYGFFLNGWPKECYYEKAVDLGFGQNIETRYIEWISRNWHVYVLDDESTDNKEI